MKLLVLIFLSLIFFTDVSAQTTPPSTALQEANKLSSEVVKLFKQKKFDEAQPLAQKVIEIREKESGKEHLSLAESWLNLAYVQERREKTAEAKRAFENALDIYEKNQPLSAKDEKRYIEILGTVATYQASNGSLDKAEQRLQRAIELSEKSNGKDSLETGDLLLRLGILYQVKLQYDKAAPLLLRVLEIKNSKLGKTDEETRFAYSNAACALRKSGQEEQIKPLSEIYDPPRTDKDFSTGKIINGGVMNGKALELAKPPYPAEARAKRASGSVAVEVIIDEAGKIIFACAASGAKELQRASEIAAYNSKFSPTTLSGQPVRVKGVIVYNYVP